MNEQEWWLNKVPSLWHNHPLVLQVCRLLYTKFWNVPIPNYFSKSNQMTKICLQTIPLQQIHMEFIKLGLVCHKALICEHSVNNTFTILTMTWETSLLIIALWQALLIYQRHPVKIKFSSHCLQYFNYSLQKVFKLLWL